MARANRSIVNSKPNTFNSTWKTDNTSVGSSAANQIALPLSVSGSYNFTVYWGDGTNSQISSALQPATTHSYATAGTYSVTMSGYIRGFQFNNGGDRRKITSISQWGGLKLSSAGAQFYGCDNLTLNNISDTPHLYFSNVNGLSGPTLSAAFRSCSLLTSISRVEEWDTSKIDLLSQTFYAAMKFNQNIGNWNTSNATSLSFIFCGPTPAFTHSFNNGGSDSIKNWDTSKVNNFNGVIFYNPNFNQPIGNWNVSSGSNFNNMFTFATSFNQPLNNWDTRNAVSMSQMFWSASSFNQPLNNWNTSKVVTMVSMFYAANNFNQDIGSWDVGRVTNMGSMFQAPILSNTVTASFNNGGSPSINNWNTSNVTNMSFMFQQQINFNQPIGNWNTSKVTDMQYMFNVPGNARQANGTFNQPIGNWDMSNVTNTQYMLNGQYLFNQNIGNWNLSKVTNAQGMLKMLGAPYSASVFNNGGSDSIKNWNLSSSTNIAQLFENAYGFDQPLGNWNISNVTNASSFMGTKSNINYSAANYDALLIGWASRPVKPNVSINFNNIKFTAAASASRASLIAAPNNWTIADGGQL